MRRVRSQGQQEAFALRSATANPHQFPPFRVAERVGWPVSVNSLRHQYSQRPRLPSNATFLPPTFSVSDFVHFWGRDIP
jgi:hypothetical protein